MRKIVSGLFVSLDGVVETPEAWTGPYFSPEIGQIIGQLMAGGDTLLLGRVTYDTFKASFSGGDSGNPMAAQMNQVRKVVVSNTLPSAEWQNSTLVAGDVESAIQALKAEDGATINMSGSPSLVNWLLQKELLDELHLLVFPLVVGRGRRLFEGATDTIALELASSQQLPSGVVSIDYRVPERNEP